MTAPDPSSTGPATDPAADRGTLTARRLWQLARVGVPQLAPDGARAVVTVTHFEGETLAPRTALWLLPTTGAVRPRQLTRCRSRDAQPAFSPRGDAIAFVARRTGAPAGEGPQLHLIDPDGGEARAITRFGPGVAHFMWLPGGRRIVFAAWLWPDAPTVAAQQRRHDENVARKDSGYATESAFWRSWDHEIPQDRALGLVLLDVASGRLRLLTQGLGVALPHDGDDSAAVMAAHPDGRRIAFECDPDPVPRAGNRRVLVELELATRRVRHLGDAARFDHAQPRYSPCGRWLACLRAETGRVHTALAQPACFDLAEPAPAARDLAPGWDRHAEGPLRFSADGTALLFTAEDQGRCHLLRVPTAGGSPEAVFDGGWVQGFDAAAGRVVVAADAALHPVRLYALDDGPRAAHRARPHRLERFNDRALAALRLGEVREHWVPGAQGEPVQLWLTLPPGFDARRRHAVVHVIHGGPHAAAGDTWGWRWNPHVFAAPGQVIVQVNYHGSSGFGHAFRHSLIGRQGELELQDLQAATRWVLAQRWADASRVYATGGSYGGFLVAWMNGHLPPWPAGPIRAYVCHAGVFDRVATFSADSYTTRPLDLAARYWDDLPRVLAQSPHAYAGAMATPTLVTHGARDYRVPDCNGLAYYNTLKARGVPARLLWFGDENHWVLKGPNSLQWYAEWQAWLDAQGARGGRAAARPRQSRR